MEQGRVVPRVCGTAFTNLLCPACTTCAQQRAPWLSLTTTYVLCHGSTRNTPRRSCPHTLPALSSCRAHNTTHATRARRTSGRWHTPAAAHKVHSGTAISTPPPPCTTKLQRNQVGRTQHHTQTHQRCPPSPLLSTRLLPCSARDRQAPPGAGRAHLASVRPLTTVAGHCAFKVPLPPAVPGRLASCWGVRSSPKPLDAVAPHMLLTLLCMLPSSFSRLCGKGQAQRSAHDGERHVATAARSTARRCICVGLL
jgi:hypothetical protein